ncbi:pyruvate dehydrogenase [acetyl-transferring]-phosphatase 1, mitochondrial-like isoform X1 [Limulus polyphemus]|uniref:Pyruvate dehydrogenase [acetyl-transferring]-phosphatase 1, mitochondrial-like isoform X1 n=2 Tax=Limulus polyphemus TaxID=6850 RepID=A0ABM1C4Y1_LIMPO|nr:pyruvate dehydrogenase [acetyl-transferring]-phosphatase 1, mitochondrial-like isoform X1 [Limulus polyphemus]
MKTAMSSIYFLNKKFIHYLNSKYFHVGNVLQQQARLANSYGAPKLSPQEVTMSLSANEGVVNKSSGSVRGFDYNQLPSNNPIEDRLAVGHCQLTTGMLFGIFDGHGGNECANLISHRLLDYVALSILPENLLKEYLDYLHSGIEPVLVEKINDPVDLTDFQRQLHRESLRNYALQLVQRGRRTPEYFMDQALTQAFTQLDEDMSQEIQQQVNNKNFDLLPLAVTGSCACLAHIDGTHIHIASSGDCKAVLGMLSDDKKWSFKALSKEHNADNVDELRRIIDEHPKPESNFVIKNERLLGQLAPLRAFGDYSYKWKASLLKQLLVPQFGPAVIPPNYYSPPYLTARPEVIHHRLTPRDKFLVIASDGLWEQLMPHKVVKFVGQHMSGRQTLDVLRLPRRNMKLKEIDSILHQRKEGLAKKPVDANAATHLIRIALGRTEYGVEHSKLASMLSLPDELVRTFRDDITIIVIYFDSDFLRHSPAD